MWFRNVGFRFTPLLMALLLLTSHSPLVGSAHGEVTARESGEISTTDRQYWAYQPVHRPNLPAVQDDNWPQSPIDHFILACLEFHEAAVVEPANQRVLVRRATFDLTGLPPTPSTINDFLQDDSPDAFSQLLDRLLASPRYGERWARHWLDVARYGEDIRPNNYTKADLPMAYRYRDWVIKAWNTDLSYDRFVMMQVSGDQMPDTSFDGHLAMGFLSLGPVYGSDGGTTESVALAAAETLDDKVDVISRSILGLTVACARCHDHKFDPIPTADYYSLAGAIHNTNFDFSAPLASPEEVAKYKKTRQTITAMEKRITELEQQQPVQVASLNKLKSEHAELLAAAPKAYSTAHSAADRTSSDMAVAIAGNPSNPGPTVPRRMLRILAGEDPAHFTQGSGRRELAAALASRENPLFSRVMVNRLWQHHFGRAIVATPDNFGLLGTPPSHPHLLDWLADELANGDWSIKRMQRQIMLSSTYQLSSHHSTPNAQLDENNHLLWRMNRRRLDVESWRDAMLAVAGTLDNQMGGPSQSDLFTSRRRTVYGRVSRHNITGTDQFLRLFDFPDANTSNSQRTQTTVPQQQLFVMNNPFVLDQSSALARRLTAAAEGLPQRIRYAFELVYGRLPSVAEIALAQQYFDSQTTTNADSSSSWEQYAHVLLASSEFMYLE